MSLDQLIKELAEIKHPLMVMRSGEAMQRVFDLYRTIAGREPRGSGRCYSCACDAWHELNRISQVGTGWDNSLNLPDWIPVTDLTIIHKMEKYKMTVKSFRPFGSPDTITELNTTDAQVETLIKANPEFEKFFVLRDAKKANAKAQFEIESQDSKAGKAKSEKKPKAEKKVDPAKEHNDDGIPEGQAWHEEEVVVNKPE
ncbi:MAG TPA: hypothetical protein PKI14_11375 [Fervidobacterium sp.]|nr:hypothetical protein [Fervidobacterium sp.]